MLLPSFRYQTRLSRFPGLAQFFFLRQNQVWSQEKERDGFCCLCRFVLQKTIPFLKERCPFWTLLDRDSCSSTWASLGFCAFPDGDLHIQLITWRLKDSAMNKLLRFLWVRWANLRKRQPSKSLGTAAPRYKLEGGQSKEQALLRDVVHQCFCDFSSEVGNFANDIS